PVFRLSKTKVYLPRYYAIEKYGIPKRYNHPAGDPIELVFEGSLRDIQQQTIDATLKIYEQFGGGLISLDTGLGKTVVALKLISLMKVKTLIIVHAEFLLEQWIERIKQFLPDARELDVLPNELSGPIGDEVHSPVEGIVHRYPDRVLFLVTDRCASYCRYCTRSRVVSGVGEQHLDTQMEAAFRYLEGTPEVRDVLLSGGDPLLFSDDKLDKILTRLRSIPHIQFVRIGSRIPIFLPQRITPELCAMLKKHHPLFISIHTNHPRELTSEVRDALSRLADAGIPLGNQSVLLEGLNDTVEIQKALVHKLLMCRVRPYYLYQCDLITGSSHLRTSVAKGLDIIEGLRGHTTGYAVPQFVIDGPGGGGKIPLNPEYVITREPGRIMLRNYEGSVFEYPEPTPIPKEALEELHDRAMETA
ncbi:MAG: KamA family radical SAM protein, partial [Verrucomicrobiales bacterium]